MTYDLSCHDDFDLSIHELKLGKLFFYTTDALTHWRLDVKNFKRYETNTSVRKIISRPFAVLHSLSFFCFLFIPFSWFFLFAVILSTIFLLRFCFHLLILCVLVFLPFLFSFLRFHFCLFHVFSSFMISCVFLIFYFSSFLNFIRCTNGTFV